MGEMVKAGKRATFDRDDMAHGGGDGDPLCGVDEGVGGAATVCSFLLYLRQYLFI